METFFVTTQTLENYGAHCESGKFADNHAYWKFKNGSDYIITGVDRLQDAVAFVAAITMENGIGYKEFPCHFEQVPHDYQTEYEMAQLAISLGNIELHTVSRNQLADLIAIVVEVESPECKFDSSGLLIVIAGLI